MLLYQLLARRFMSKEREDFELEIQKLENEVKNKKRQLEKDFYIKGDFPFWKLPSSSRLMYMNGVNYRITRLPHKVLVETLHDDFVADKYAWASIEDWSFGPDDECLWQFVYSENKPKWQLLTST